MAPPVTPRTAARRAKKASPHVPFNARPKDVGTRTGLAMPLNVARDSMGFENPSEFFMSPNGTEAPGTTNTIRTFGGTAASLMKSTAGPSRIGVGSAGMGNDQTPAPAGKKGRFQQLAGGSDEEDVALGEDLLNDGDDILDHRLSSPGPWFATNEPPTVTLPTPSQVPAASPSAGFDDLPTPQRVTASLRRTPRIGVGKGPQSSPLRSSAAPSAIVPSPAKSTASSNQHMDDLDLELAEMDDEGPSGMDMDVSTSGPSNLHDMASPPVRSPNKRNRKSTATSVGDFRDMEDDHRLSLGRIKSRDRIVDPDDEDNNDGPGAGDFSFGAEDASVPMDLGNDDQFDAGENGFGDITQDMTDGDISLEAAAIARENEAGEDEEEEEEEDEPLPRPVKTKTKPAARSRATSSQARNARQAEKVAERKRMRLSRIGAEDENQYVGDFVMRRSGRTHMAPLEYWRGEKVAYGRGHGLAEVKEVIRLQPDIRPSLSKSRAARARSQSEKPRRQVAEDKENFEGWDDNTDPVGHVTEYLTRKDIQRRIAFTKDHLEPKQVSGSDFKYQKVFGEDQFIASGVVYIPVGGSKPSKQSKDNSYVFYVIAGAVQVTVTKTSFVMAPGGMFMVPRGNEYEISNLSRETEAELFFAQARKIRSTEADETAFERLQAQARARSASLAASEKPESRARTREASEDDEDEEDVTPKGKRRARAY